MWVLTWPKVGINSSKATESGKYHGITLYSIAVEASSIWNLASELLVLSVLWLVDFHWIMSKLQYTMGSRDQCLFVNFRRFSKAECLFPCAALTTGNCKRDVNESRHKYVNHTAKTYHKKHGTNKHGFRPHVQILGNWNEEVQFQCYFDTRSTAWFREKFSVILTHWGRVTHICVGKLTIIGSDNGLSPNPRQAIIWTNAGILLIGPFGTNFIEISIEIRAFQLKKMHIKMSSAKWWPSCLGLDVLNGVSSNQFRWYGILTAKETWKKT